MMLMKRWIAIALLACTSPRAPAPPPVATASSAVAAPPPSSSASSVEPAAPSPSAAAVGSTTTPSDALQEEPVNEPLGTIDSCYNGWSSVPSWGSSTTAGLVTIRELRGNVVKATGALTVEVARAKICDGYAAPRACFAAAKSTLGPGPTTAVIALAVDASGAVSKAAIDSSDAAASLTTCLLNALKAIKFPKAGTLTYRFDVPPKPPRTMKITDPSPIIGVGLPKDVVRRRVRMQFPRLHACYVAALKSDAKLAGTLTASFAINAKGLPNGVAVRPGTLKDAAIIACVSSAIASIEFPEPEGVASVSVMYTFVFAVED
jgi:hypothetical protein